MESISQELRQAVLQAAIQGKLTKQLPEDGNASDLLKKIKAEKERLIKEKKIKKEKTLEFITEDEIPFDIPDNWAWVSLKGLVSRDIRRGKSPKYGKGKAFAFAQKCNSKYDGIRLDLALSVTDDFAGRFVDGDEVQDGDIIINSTGTGTLGRIGYFESKLNPNGIKYYPDSHVAVVRCFDVCSKYILACLRYYQEYLESKGEGSTNQKELKPDTIKHLMIPLPPSAEQERIVARVEELMAKIDELEKVETELQSLHQVFPNDMKAALLQAAMQGKLTEQLSEDGYAKDLLEQIKFEKERLVKEKKIKREKELEPITEDDVPFDIPDNWEWTHIGNIFKHNAGKALNAKNTKGRKFKYITTSNVYWDHFDLENLREMYYTEDEIEKYSVRKGDLLVLEGGDIGRTAIWDRDEVYCVQNHVHRLRPYVSVVVKYFYYCMMYFKSAGMVNGKGIAIQGLSANALHSIIIPLPPPAEQERIVEKLDRLLPLCDSLQTEL